MGKHKGLHSSDISIRLSPQEAKDICRIGQGKECCAFLVSGAGGFHCWKRFFPDNSSIHFKLEQGTMNAKGMGGWEGCRWEGES